MGRGTRAAMLLGIAAVVAVLVGIALAGLLRSEGWDPGGPGSPQALQQPSALSEREPAAARAPLPEITLPGLAGGPDIAVARYRGRPLVINFWATWCAPCVEEMPALQEVAAAAQGKVAFLGVNEVDAPDAASAFVAKLGITYDLAADPRQDFFHQIGAFGMPTTLLVDPQGTIVYRHTGPLDAPELRWLLAKHLSVQL